MYLVQLGRELVLMVDTIIEGMTVAVDAFKNDWEVDVINTITGEVVVSLRDGSVPYFSAAIHETLQLKKLFEQTVNIKRFIALKKLKNFLTNI